MADRQRLTRAELAALYRLAYPDGSYLGDPPEKWTVDILVRMLRTRLADRARGELAARLAGQPPPPPPAPLRRRGRYRVTAELELTDSRGPAAAVTIWQVQARYHLEAGSWQEAILTASTQAPGEVRP